VVIVAADDVTVAVDVPSVAGMESLACDARGRRRIRA